MVPSKPQGGCHATWMKTHPVHSREADRIQLQGGGAKSTTMPHALVLRARMILASAEGITNAAVAH